MVEYHLLVPHILYIHHALTLSCIHFIFVHFTFLCNRLCTYIKLQLNKVNTSLFSLQVTLPLPWPMSTTLTFPWRPLTTRTTHSALTLICRRWACTLCGCSLLIRRSPCPRTRCRWSLALMSERVMVKVLDDNKKTLWRIAVCGILTLNRNERKIKCLAL